ncbi:MAG: hypothetical protein BroJett040_14440 [Oligoflexia bacterium]|nr:MAG: hypothetical protein BroJett040_14440 [Oligoflexia bacterium]
MKSIFIAIIFVFLAEYTYAQNCEQQFIDLKNKIYYRYSLEEKRKILERVRLAMTTSENEELSSLANKFKSIPADSNDHMNDLYILQNEARRIVRTVTARAGFKVLNADQGSPFDALIGEKTADDGFTDYYIEVRSLLIRKDSKPHVTIWAYRENPKINPWKMISIGVVESSDQDYASWRGADGVRSIGLMKDFIKSQMPLACQL